MFSFLKDNLNLEQMMEWRLLLSLDVDVIVIEVYKRLGKNCRCSAIHHEILAEL